MVADALLSTSPLETLTSDDGVLDIESLPQAIQALLTDYEAPEFIAGPLADEFRLLPEQRYDIARFLMELVLGKITEMDAPARLADLADLDIGTARRMLRSIEEGVLAPNNLSLSGLFRLKNEPLLITDGQGNEGLRYASLDDLLADLEPLNTQERMRFLEDAKPFNRMFVLQAFSQLKMKADTSGKSLSFRQQVAHEAGELSAQDWTDLLRIDPDALTESGIASFLAQTPLGTALEDKSPLEAQEYLLRVAALSPEAQALLVDRSTVSALDGLVAQGALPATHKAAATKIISFLVLGDIPPAQTAVILTRLGLPAESAARVAVVLNNIAVPVPRPAPPAPVSPPVQMRPIMPLTQRIPPIGTVADSSKSPGRNIIDLRKQQSEL